MLFYWDTPPDHKLHVALLSYFNMTRHAVCSTPALELQQCRHAVFRRCISVVCCAPQAIMDGKHPTGLTKHWKWFASTIQPRIIRLRTLNPAIKTQYSAFFVWEQSCVLFHTTNFSTVRISKCVLSRTDIMQPASREKSIMRVVYWRPLRLIMWQNPIEC